MTDFEDHFEDMTEETEEFTDDIEELIEEELGTPVSVQQVRYQPEQGRYYLNVNPEGVGEKLQDELGVRAETSGGININIYPDDDPR